MQEFEEPCVEETRYRVRVELSIKTNTWLRNPAPEFLNMQGFVRALCSGEVAG